MITKVITKEKLSSILSEFSKLVIGYRKRLETGRRICILASEFKKIRHTSIRQCNRSVTPCVDDGIFGGQNRESFPQGN